MRTFIQQYMPWVGLLFVLNVVVNLLIFLDDGLATVSIIYFNIVYVFIVMSFLVVRASLDRQIVANIEEADLTPMQQHVATYYKEQLHELEQHLKKYKMHVAEYNDEQLAWVHEMKAPLTALQLIIEHMEHSEAKRKLEQEWLRIYNLLDQQLYTVRVQTIEQDVRFEEVHLREVIVNEVRHFKSWCLEKGIGFELEDIEKTVVSDAKWLAYIVRQLLSNAIKYSEPNSEVSVYTSTDTEGHIVLHIRDVGKGIAAHDLPRVFQKSYTGSTGRESSAASGMGLYLAKQAADKLGHKIMLDSAVGLGTTAKVQFPLENEYMKRYGM